MEGRFYGAVGANTEAGGIFSFQLAKDDNNSLTYESLLVKGVFGATQTSFTTTGDAPRVVSGFDSALMNGLLDRTNGLTGVHTQTQLDFMLPSLAYIQFSEASVTSYPSFTQSGSGLSEVGAVFYSSDPNELHARLQSDISDRDYVNFDMTAASLAGAVQNDTLIVLEQATPTNGKATLVLSRPGSDTFGLDYAGFGFWAIEEATGAFTTGDVVYGQRTADISQLPLTGTATYSGAALGVAYVATTSASSHDLVASGNYGSVMGTSRLDVDFAAARVDLTLSNLQLQMQNGHPAYALSDISGTGSWAGTSKFSGELSVPTASSSGNGFSGNFYGPANPIPPEVAGQWNATISSPASPSELISMRGVFTGKH